MGKALMMAGDLDEADRAFRLGIFDVSFRERMDEVWCAQRRLFCRKLPKYASFCRGLLIQDRGSFVGGKHGCEGFGLKSMYACMLRFAGFSDLSRTFFLALSLLRTAPPSPPALLFSAPLPRRGLAVQQGVLRRHLQRTCRESTSREREGLPQEVECL